MSVKNIVEYTVKSKPVNALRFGAAAVFAAMSGAAYADDFSEVKKVEVTVKVAELSSPTGAKNVYEMLSEKAVEACTPVRVPASQDTIEECAADLLDQFVENLKNPQILTLHTRQDA